MYSPHISINGTDLNAVEHFTYLGSIISSDATISKDLDNRLSKAWFLWKTFKKSMAEPLAPPLHKDLSIQGRYHSHPPVRCRDLGSHRKQIRLLERFHQYCLSAILGIKWPDYVSNEEVLKGASLPSIESILLQVQLHWAGHISRMEDIHLPKTVFFSELQAGKRDRGAPRKHYKNQLKRQLAQAGISHQSWQQEASDGDSWHSSVRKASCEFKTERHEAAKERCRRQKELAASQSSSAQTLSLIHI